ncbi:hypothetical protein EFA69_15380 [Rufibacter immobilis]|uniref:Outer membrane protein assembly factor BamE n=1 Tax=Rufibacter immobilis TaxID=1348778 RepID=A0A3M9MPR6_9BACT|nr:hypothetical protein [Rufibacter immobilis]RNI27506.1 hypothetical protein EFA69_15380 [Rufibacter immobilis]
MTTLLYLPTIFGISLDVYLIMILLGVPTFAFFRWVLKKFIINTRTRRITTWATTIVATPVIYMGLIMLLLKSLSYHPRYDFKRERWMAAKEKRYELSSDIIDSKMLLGKTKPEVRQLLGDEGNTDLSDHWNYYLGFRPGFANIDPDVLDIEFKDGKVVKVGQHET